MVILENIDIDIDKAILQNIDIDKISNQFKFGISNRATPTPPAQPGKDDPLTTESRGRTTAALDLFLLYKNVMTAAFI